MRVFVAMFSHETNTFSNIPTNRRQFEACDLRYGGEILEVYRGTGTCLGGMIDAAERHGATLLPSIAAAASPAGRVTADIYRHVTERLLADLSTAGPLDGVLLDLHGAMVPETTDDGEGDVLAAVRQAVGPAVPIAVTLDFHSNFTRAMVRHADLLIGYKTYPHVDMAERGVEAAERLFDMASGRLRPTAALRQPRLLPPLGSQRTAGGETTWAGSGQAGPVLTSPGRAVWTQRRASTGDPLPPHLARDVLVSQGVIPIAAQPAGAPSSTAGRL